MSTGKGQHFAGGVQGGTEKQEDNKMWGQKKVAFYANQSESYGPVGENLDFVFDRLITNVGSGYTQNTGRFRAPVKATYQFIITIAAQEGEKAAFTMVKNGSYVMTAWADSNPKWATSTNVAILPLEAGDQVWLQLRKEASMVYGGEYTSFSGYLIFEN